MTISINNTTYETCPICRVDYTNAEREDTVKVVELSCRHFYHIDCLSTWFIANEKNHQDLSCCYCNQLSMPKSLPLTIINQQTVERRLTEIEQNQDFGSKADVMNCLAQLKPHSLSIANLMNDTVQSGWAESDMERFSNWIDANIQEESQFMACLLIGEVFTRRQTLRTLEQEVRHLAKIPFKKWSTEITGEGIPVSYFTNDTNEFRMRVSKEYLQKATCAYLYEKIHNIEKFEENLAKIEILYYYDQEVLDCIQDTKNLRKDISDTIKENPSLPIERMMLLIQEVVKQTKVHENSKQTIPLLINEILFHRGALRTIAGEIDRWKMESTEKWPAEIKENGIYFLDKEGLLKHYTIEHFTLCVHSSLMTDKVYNVAKCLFMRATCRSSGENV